MAGALTLNHLQVLHSAFFARDGGNSFPADKRLALTLTVKR